MQNTSPQPVLVHSEISRYQHFCQAFAEEVEDFVGDEELCEVVYTDGELRNEELSLEVAELLQRSGPWGQGFPEPLFEGVFDIRDQTIVGKRHLKLSLSVPGESKWIDAIAFNVDLDAWPNPQKDSIKAAYRLDVNEFRGNRNLQLIIDHIETA